MFNTENIERLYYMLLDGEWIASEDKDGPYYGGPFRIPPAWLSEATKEQDAWKLAIASEINGVNLWAWANGPQFVTNDQWIRARKARVLHILAFDEEATVN